jgi:hypothetical protein
MCAVLTLIVAMHSVSPASLGVHPDEALHLSSFTFFLEHKWPPAANDPAIVPTLKASVWGISYLNEYDIVYFVSGHLMAPLAGLLHSPLALGRAFQVLLWLVLLACAVRRERWAIALAPMLLSAQAWYVFTYFNGDAFPVCLSMLASMFVVRPLQRFEEFLKGEAPIDWSTLMLAVCLGFLLVSKANYAVVVFGLILYLGIRFLDLSWVELGSALSAAGAIGIAAFLGKWPGPSPLHAQTIFLCIGAAVAIVFGASLVWRCRRKSLDVVRLRRFIILGVLVLVFAAPRLVNDVWLNGSPGHKAQTVAAMTEQYAQPDFKPSLYMVGEGRANLRLAQKGKPLNEMLYGMSWYSVSFRSAFGVYAHMTIWADDGIYNTLFLLLAAMAAMGAVAQIRSYGAKGAKTVVLVSGACVLVLISSILFSWFVDFEPQGRYLLPMLPFVGLLIAPAFDTPGKSAMKLLLVTMFLINVYSYAYVGIAGVEKMEIEHAAH